MPAQARWTQVTDRIWTLEDEHGHIVAHIAQVGPDAGDRAATFLLTRERGSSKHASLADAMAAAVASLR
jgi:hypothetical protein